MEIVSIQTNVLKVLKDCDSDTVLVCFPFVGANWTAFSPIIRNLTSNIKVLGINPPGHSGDDLQPLDSIHDMADLYIEELKPYLDKNLIFWGYSMGGLVTHRILEKLSKHDKEYNISVIISASVPPHLITNARSINGLNDDQVIHFFHSIGGIPTELLKEREFLDMFLPIIRADYKAFETYRAEITKFSYPCFLLYGKRDNFISHQKFIQWKNYFENPPITYYLDGGHLFIRDNAPQLVNIIQEITNTIQVNVN